MNFLLNAPPTVPYCRLQGLQLGATLHKCFAPFVPRTSLRGGGALEISGYCSVQLALGSLFPPTDCPISGATAKSFAALPPHLRL